MSIAYPDRFLDEMPVLDSVTPDTIICVASGPDYLSFRVAVSVLFNSPEFTGEPTAPTPDSLDNSTRLATTEFVQGLLAAFVSGVAIGDPITGGTAGRVPYIGPGSVLKDSATLTFDDSNPCMGIGSGVPPGNNYYYALIVAGNNYSTAGRIGLAQYGAGMVSGLTCSAYSYAFGVWDMLAPVVAPTWSNLPSFLVNYLGGISVSAHPTRTFPMLTCNLVSTTNRRSVGVIDTEWADDNDTIRRGRLLLKASDASGDRTGITIESDGAIANVTMPGDLTVGGKYHGDGSQLTGISGGGGGAIPGGAVGDLQWNNDGVLAGDGPNWDGSSVLTIASYTGGTSFVISGQTTNSSSGVSQLVFKNTGVSFGTDRIAMVQAVSGDSRNTGRLQFYLKRGSSSSSLASVAYFDEYGDFVLEDGVIFANNGNSNIISNYYSTYGPYAAYYVTNRSNNSQAFYIYSQSGNFQVWSPSKGQDIFTIDANNYQANFYSSVNATRYYAGSSGGDYFIQAGTMGMQVNNVGSCFIGDNISYSSPVYRYKDNGPAVQISMLGTAVEFNFAPNNSSGPGAQATPVNALRVDSGGNTTIVGNLLLGGVLGPHGSTRVASDTGPFDLSQADWFFRTLNGSNGALTVINEKPMMLFTIEFLQGGVGNYPVSFTGFGTIIWMTTGAVQPPIALAVGLRTTLLFKRIAPASFIAWLTGSQA